MPKFRKKPVVIEAEQFFPDKRPYPKGVCNTPDGICGCVLLGGDTGPHIHTLEGLMHVGPGDWIITAVKGERYPCKPDIFAATYEAIVE